MDPILESTGFELIYVVVNRGSGSRVLHMGKKCKISGGSIVIGKGTAGNRVLEILAMGDVRKEIVLMAAGSSACSDFLEKLNKELKLYKPNHGIAYSVPLAGICGSRSCRCNNLNECGEEDGSMYHSIIVIVDKGRGEDVVEAASKAGSNGATIINARGSGIHETGKLFGMEIEPEKEIVLMITKSDRTNGIVDSIRDSLQIDKSGNGILFIQNVRRAYGLYE